MDKFFEELKIVLSDELKIHSDCVQTATDMNTAIKKKEVEKVQRLTDQFDTLIGQIETIEIRRLELCDSITKALRPEHRHMNLQNIITLVPEKEQESFTEIRSSLKKKITELARINTSNQLLLNESLVAIGMNFKLIAQSHHVDTGYKQTGAIQKQPVHRHIINHVA